MTNWHTSYFHPKPAEYPSALLPHQEEWIRVNQSYIDAGSSEDMRELCSSFHGKDDPCRYVARPGRMSCGRANSG